MGSNTYDSLSNTEQEVTNPSCRKLLDEVRAAVHEMELRGFRPFSTQDKKLHTFEVALSTVFDERGSKYFRAVVFRSARTVRQSYPGIFVDEGPLDASPNKIRIKVVLQEDVRPQSAFEFLEQLSTNIIESVELGVMALNAFAR